MPRTAVVFVALASLGLARAGSAAEMFPGDVLQIPFQVHKENFDPAVPNLLAVSFDVEGVVPSFFDFTLALYDGPTLLAQTNPINAFDVGVIVGIFFDAGDPLFPILAGEAPLFAAISTPAPFQSIQDGTIAGRIQFSFASDSPFFVELATFRLVQILDLELNGEGDPSWVSVGDPDLVSAVPEPASGLLLFSGLCLLGCKRCSFGAHRGDRAEADDR